MDLRKLLVIQVAISVVAFLFDIYGCINFALPPAVSSVSIGILDLVILFWFLKEKRSE